MRRTTITLALLLAACAHRAPVSPDGADVRGIAAHHVHIEAHLGDRVAGVASGVAVSVPGVPGAVLTAAHVCRGPMTFVLRDAADREVAARPVRQDDALDLCLMSAPGLGATPAPLAGAPARAGERLQTVVGDFFGARVLPVAEHLYSGEHDVGTVSRGIMVPGLYPGDSGGGVWRGGELVGLVIGKFEHPATHESVIGVMVLGRDVREFLTR